MKIVRSKTPLLFGLFAFASGCSDAFTPVLTEHIDAEFVTMRPLSSGEHVPTVRTIVAPGTVLVEVTRKALCTPLIRGTIARTRESISILARLSGSAGALCIGDWNHLVQVYRLTVRNVQPGYQNILFAEAIEEGPPVVLSRSRVLIPPR